MKKYYATQYHDESVDSSIYYSEDDAVYDKLWAGGNHWMGTLNDDFRTDTVKAIEDCHYDLGTVDDDFAEKEVDLFTDYEQQQEYLSVIRSYFGNDVTEADAKKLQKLVYEYMGCHSREENSILCKVLEVMYGEPFVDGTFHGYSQGDWLEVIYPKSLQPRISWIEAVVMGTGSEFGITTEKVEPEEVDEADCYNDYTDLWKDADIKDWLCGYIGCQPDELVVRVLKSNGEYREF